MLNTNNCAIEYPKYTEEEKRVPFNELMKVQQETLQRAENTLNQILAMLDRRTQAEEQAVPKIPDFKTALQFNLELSHRIADKLDGVRMILEG